ncbi:TraB domain-containing protein [Porphyridium purpureum]|uniref:TraB domain-containing protein n=1 Tax=Porphyridium purpureum TaxID=35688 RepID=A0A5J4YMG8_PORPP|nr:TraB domain-containing protein [Porphyridium purpureum]|eukprot:POR5000..scf295_9
MLAFAPPAVSAGRARHGGQGRCVTACVSADSQAARTQVVETLTRRGVLTVLHRPEDYRDRRDGYVEPEVMYVLGTSHVSTQSVRDCEELVRAVRPEIVVVELCRSRAGVMYADASSDHGVNDGSKVRSRTNPFLIRAQGKASLLSSALRSGISGIMLRALLVRFSSQVQSGREVRMYQEFAAARRAGELVGAEIVLGDRPIEMTLRRSWECMPWGERVKFVGLVLQNSNSNFSDFPETELVSGSVLDSYHRLFQEEFPTLHRTLVTERDAYLAWSIKRSHAVCGKKCVVAVVGAGHVPGITRNIVADRGGDRLRFQQLIGREDVSDVENENRDLASGEKANSRPVLVWPYSSQRGSKQLVRLVRRVCIDGAVLACADAVFNSDGMTRHAVSSFGMYLQSAWHFFH